MTVPASSLASRRRRRHPGPRLHHRRGPARSASRPTGDNPVIENLNARITAWWVMVILLAIAFIAGKPGVVLLFALCLLRRPA